MLRIQSPRLRYTLRGLFVSVTLFCVWGGCHTNRALKERRAEQVLLLRQASFQYGPKLAGSGWTSKLKFAYCKLIQFVWRERFITAVYIDAPLDPEVVDALVALPYLNSLLTQPKRYPWEEMQGFYKSPASFPKQSIPEEALPKILANSEVSYLAVSMWSLSDKDCAAIARESSLRELSIDGSQVTEEGLVALLAISNLERFSFRFCGVTGEKLASVGGSNTLDFIQCDLTPVGHEFARFVARSPKVACVTLASDSIDDEFVALLSDHPSLTSIQLVRSSVTDACIPDLIRWKSLQVVELPSTGVSQWNSDRLRSARLMSKFIATNTRNLFD